MLPLKKLLGVLSSLELNLALCFTVALSCLKLNISVNFNIDSIDAKCGCLFSK